MYLTLVFLEQQPEVRVSNKFMFRYLHHLPTSVDPFTFGHLKLNNVLHQNEI